MRTSSLISSAVQNSFRAKTRTLLTVLAVFIGAFTLTVTNGLGTGVGRFIDDTVAAIGADGVLTATKASETAPTGFGDEPLEYDPDVVDTTVPGAPDGAPGATTGVVAMTPDDIAELEQIEGVDRVEPTKGVSADFIRYGEDGTPYVTAVENTVPGQKLQMAAGSEPSGSSDEPEVAIPVSLVEPLGFADPDSAIGEIVTIAVTDGSRTQHLLEATVTGVVEETFSAGTTTIPNSAATDELFALQNTGVPEEDLDRYATASVFFDPEATDAEVEALKERLDDAGYTGQSIADQLGAFVAVIDGIVLILNAFAIIALVAATLGIVNTLLMSVQERTREIGLMKAMGMGSGRVFALFSLEAMFIGFLGSALGAAAAIALGTTVSRQLAATLLADLPGLELFAFDPLSIVLTTAVVMFIAFLAGTLPAARAAAADPVASLRYE
ncbi:MAG: permease [Microbacterium sp.]|uniref:ABC transporter permease n=1 Tax=unclassified Microbacterium TaxID=2609290 RepID=UPI000C372791|nr:MULTISPECIES: ABC transporter permease [unclassified Microbacterium]MAM55514.1 permease [Microbacterium sp.]MAY49926.1 permease [Microbacterium sp.]HAS33496.1 permease [Microbacterium sp.]HBS75501.1 permease [Microbacterium sp.]